MVSRGFYRHYKGHAYYVHGVACLKHENDRRIVIYTSVKTEESNEGFGFLARDERDFLMIVNPRDGGPCTHTSVLHSKCDCGPRFRRITDPELSITPQGPNESAPIDTRKLVNDFLSLPFLSRSFIMGRMGFPDHRDYFSQEQEVGCRFFEWIRENKLIDRLQSVIKQACP